MSVYRRFQKGDLGLVGSDGVPGRRIADVEKERRRTELCEPNAALRDATESRVAEEGEGKVDVPRADVFGSGGEAGLGPSEGGALGL